MMKIAFLGGGKIGRAMIEHVREKKNGEIEVVYDPFIKETEVCGVKVVDEIPANIFQGLDLVVECAEAKVLTEHLEDILPCCSIMPFSMTAFRDDSLKERAKELCDKFGTNVFLPHGAILGLDGIFDGRDALREVSVETIKNPNSRFSMKEQQGKLRNCFREM